MNRMKRIAMEAHGNTLDVGCKQKHNPFLDTHSTIGFDIVPHECPHHQLQIGNAETIETYFPPASFDSVIAGEVIEHLNEPIRFLKGTKEILKPRGKLILTTPNPYHWTNLYNEIRLRPPTDNHVNLWSPRHLVHTLKQLDYQHIQVKTATGTKIPKTKQTLEWTPWFTHYQLMYIARTRK